jgi:crotonobetainyl-CoA:carnitine CoA-transferase CaiB-like acyl-CoA transferase
MGPLATQTLGDLGADVVVVEQSTGEPNRSMGGGPIAGFSGVSLNLMRNKRSIVLDLKAAEGRATLNALIPHFDVFVTTMRPGAVSRLGLNYDDVASLRSDIVYCQAQGFPIDSAESENPAYDDIIQSASGLVDLSIKVDGEPRFVPTVVADKVSGLVMAQAITAALFHRERTGEGQYVEVPMVDAMRAFVLVEHGNAAISEPPAGAAGYARILSNQRSPQRTSDGWISILPYTKEHYDTLFALGDKAFLLGDARYATLSARVEHSAFLYSHLRDTILTESTAWWVEFCRRESIPASPIVSLEELIAELPIHSHPAGVDYRVIPPAARFSRTPQSVRRPAPAVGADTDDVLAEFLYHEVAAAVV